MNIGFNAVTKRIFLGVSDYYTARFGRLPLQRIPVHFIAKLFQCAKRKLSFTFTVEDNDVGKYILVCLRPSLNSISSFPNRIIDKIPTSACPGSCVLCITA